MIKRILLLAVFIAGFPLAANSQNNDPCSNAQLIQSVAINTASAVSTRLVTSTDAEKKTYICNFVVTMVGAATANTIAIQYGTGSTCQTGTTLRSGTFKASVVVGSSTVVNLRPNTVQPIPVGNSTCVLTTTTDAVNGILSYALQ